MAIEGGHKQSRASWFPPSISEARHALDDLHLLLKSSKRGHKGIRHQNLPRIIIEQVDQMTRFLWTYVDTQPANPTGGYWSKAADKTAWDIYFGQISAQALSRRLQKWTCAYIEDQNQLPIRQKSQRASPISDEAVVEELSIHLRSIGKYACAQDLIYFLKVTENRARLGISQPISLVTAHHWMKYMGWRWKKEVKGQYVNGHERSDVIAYRQQVFLPAWTRLQS